jgi:predicted DNA-binding protein
MVTKEVKEKTLKLSTESHRKLKILSSDKGLSIKSYLNNLIHRLYEEYQGIDTLPLSHEEMEAVRLSDEDIKAGRVQTLEEVIQELGE